MPRIDRRQFLRRAGGMAGLGLVSCTDLVGPEDSPGALTPAARSLRVVVVGAGSISMSGAGSGAWFRRRPFFPSVRTT